MNKLTALTEKDVKFSSKQKINLYIHSVKTAFSMIFTTEKTDTTFNSKTRGNVIQRIGGTLSAEEHDKYCKSALNNIHKI